MANMTLEFRERGACNSSDVPVSIFFPEKGDGDSIKAAKRVCAGCSVRDECLQYAMRHWEQGIWGGTTDYRREEMRRRTRINWRVVA